MCGICGRVEFESRNPVDMALLKKMCDVLKHRGPDDEGYYNKGFTGLGHRRLSIIDLDSGHQPMSNEDGTIWVVFNGEIYNFIELHEELVKKGHKFRTNSDTEVIVHAYEEYGHACLSRFLGMFAIALWDEKKEKLFLARDRLGKKPLHYAFYNGGLSFGSEIKSILEDKRFSRRVNLSSLNNYLTYQYVPSPDSIFEGVKKLPPASYLVLKKKRVRIEKYWKLSCVPKVKRKLNEACEELWDILREATKIRLRSDVPLGVFLSGGLDSSVIAYLMAELMSRPVKTFSIGFAEKEFNELEYAKRVANIIGAEHREFIVKPNAMDILPKLVWHYNEPFADPSALPTYYVSKITRQNVTVALNGDGGDENFAGYRRYSAHKNAALLQKIPKLLREKLPMFAINQIPEKYHGAIAGKARRFVEGHSATPAFRHVQWFSIFDNAMKETYYSDDFKETLKGEDSYDIMGQFFKDTDAQDVIDAALYVDTMTYLPDDLLVKVDVASMANSLEARSPFVDHRVFEFTASLDPSFKLRGNTPKFILKKVMEGKIPKDIIHRKKMGFRLPVDEWFRGELKDYTREILQNKTAQRGYFSPKAIETIINEHISGKFDHGYRLWSLLNLELWHRAFID